MSNANKNDRRKMNELQIKFNEILFNDRGSKLVIDAANEELNELKKKRPSAPYKAKPDVTNKQISSNEDDISEKERIERTIDVFKDMENNGFSKEDIAYLYHVPLVEVERVLK